MQEGEVKKRNRRKNDHHKVMHGLELPQMLSLSSSIGGRQEQASSTTPLCQLRALGCDLSGESQSHPYGSTNLEFYPQKFEPLVGVHDPQLSSPKMTFRIYSPLRENRPSALVEKVHRYRFCNRCPETETIGAFEAAMLTQASSLFGTGWYF